MTTLADSLPVDQLSAQARRAQPGRVTATVILWLFVAIGWGIGGIGRAVVMCAVSVRYGILRGWGLTDAEIEARAARKAARQPPPARV
jgi:hypothetical protein